MDCQYPCPSLSNITYVMSFMVCMVRDVINVALQLWFIYEEIL